MTTRKSLSRRVALTVAAVTSSVVLCAGAAAAAAPAETDPHKALVDQYSSLSGALLTFYADQEKSSLSTYLESQQVTLAPLTVANPVEEHESGEPTATPTAGGYEDMSSPTAAASPTAGSSPTVVGGLLTASQAQSLGLSGKAVTANSLVDLNRQLSSAGLTMDTSGLKSLDALATKVAANSATPDGAVTLAGAKWVSELSALHTPSLSTPKASTPNAPGIPKDALPYGLLLNKSLTTMITDFPDMFADAKKSGLGSAAMTKAWNSSMLKAYNSTKTDLSQMLPDKCTGAMLAVMASGNASSAAKAGAGSCSPSCLTGGMYLHNQAKSLFDPGRGSIVPNPTSPVWSSSTYNQFQGWAKGLALSQNPTLGGTLAQQLTGPTTTAGCDAASQATTNSLSKTLPGVFSSLR